MKWLIFTLICFCITPVMFELAGMQRGYDAIGGEVLIPLFPMLLYGIAQDLKGDVKE